MAWYDSEDEERDPNVGEQNFISSLVGAQPMREVPQPSLGPRTSLAGGTVNPMLALLPLLMQQPQQTPFQQGANAFLNGMAIARGQAPIIQQPQGPDPYKLFQMFHTVIKDQRDAQTNAQKMEMAQAASQRLRDEATSRLEVKRRDELRKSSDFRIGLYEKYGQSDDPLIRAWSTREFITGLKERGATDEELPPGLVDALAKKRVSMETIHKATDDLARGYSPDMVMDKHGLSPQDITEIQSPVNLLVEKTTLERKKLRAEVDKLTTEAVEKKYPGLGGPLGAFVSARAAKMGTPFPDMDEKTRDSVINQAVLDQQEQAMATFKAQEGIRDQYNRGLAAYTTQLQYEKSLGLAQAKQEGKFARIGADKNMWFNQKGEAATGPQLDWDHETAFKNGYFPLPETEVKRMIGLRRGFELLRQLNNTGEQLEKAGMWVKSPGARGAVEGANAWWQFYAGNPNEQKVKTQAGMETIPGNKTLLRNLEQQKTDLIILDRSLDAIGMRALGAIEPQFAAMSPSSGKPAYDRVLGQIEAALRSQAATSRTPGMFEVTPRVFPDPTKQVGTEGSKTLGPKRPIRPDQYIEFRGLGRSDQWIRDNYEVME